MRNSRDAAESREKRKLAVEILPYDPEVPKVFEELKRFILRAVSRKVKVEHVGSTAVPGLGGKNIVDAMVVVPELEDVQAVAESLERSGLRINLGASSLPEKIFLSGPFEYGGKKLHVHVHVVVKGCKEHEEKLVFRDYLRRHPEEAKKYYELKKKWSLEAGADAARYTELKSSYVKEVLKKARAELGR